MTCTLFRTSRKRARDCFRNLSRGRTISSASTLDSKIINDYAKKNPELAREALQVPPRPDPSTYKERSIASFGTTGNLSVASNLSLEDYLKWRKWNVRYIDNPWTKILLSHALSFPLTLAANADHFLPCPIENHDDTDTGEEKLQPIQINLCCVGSRAEANLPDDFWREFLICANLFQHLNGHKHRPTNASRSAHWNIDFIGPDTPSRQMQNHRIYLSGEDADFHGSVMYHKSLSMNYHTDFLHNHILKLYKSSGIGGEDRIDDDSMSLSVDDILKIWDGFVLFNPGIGHPNLKKGWKPTMDFILKTNRKVLVTAHSSLDGHRDLEVLRNTLKCESELGYQLNPFSSRMSYEDVCHANESKLGEVQPHFVRPNHCTLRF